MIKKTKCLNCRVLLTFDSSKNSTFENLDYLLSLSSGGLTIPAVDLKHYVCKSFAMLELAENIFRKFKRPERLTAEHVLSLNDMVPSFICDGHSSSIKFINRIISIIYLNNAQKLLTSQIRKDTVEHFKQRQKKRRRT